MKLLPILLLAGLAAVEAKAPAKSASKVPTTPKSTAAPSPVKPPVSSVALAPSSSHAAPSPSTIAASSSSRTSSSSVQASPSSSKATSSSSSSLTSTSSSYSAAATTHSSSASSAASGGSSSASASYSSSSSSILSGSLSTTITSYTASSTWSSTASSTTSSSTSTATPYIVWPKDGTDSTKTATLKKLLLTFVKTSTDLIESTSKGIGTNYYQLPLTPANVTGLQKNTLISSVELVGCKDNKCFDPTAAIVVQQNADDSMVYWNQKKDTAVGDYNQQYFFDDAAGDDVTVYILDMGAYIDNPDFRQEYPAGSGQSIKSRARFLFADPSDTEQTDAPNNHGTCMLSKVTGYKWGTSKRVKPVIVKVPFLSPPQTFLDGLVSIVNDVQDPSKNGKPKKSVVSMSFYFPKDVVSADWANDFRKNLDKLADLGVTLVAAAGNGALNAIDGYPASWGSSTFGDDKVESLIVVGAMNPTTGNMWWHTLNGSPSGIHGSNYDNRRRIPHIFAPGEQVGCARPFEENLKTWDQIVDGTSPATAGIAGLAAYILSLPNAPSTPKDMKDRIVLWQGLGRKAWQSQPNEKPLDGIIHAWNDVDYTTVGSNVPALVARLEAAPARLFRKDIEKFSPTTLVTVAASATPVA